MTSVNKFVWEERSEVFGKLAFQKKGFKICLVRVWLLSFFNSHGTRDLKKRIQRKDGWGGRDRTCAWRDQNPLPYHLATPQKVSF